MAIVNVELADPKWGCRFEWSQDGEAWLPTEFTAIPSEGSLRFKVTFPQEELPAYPYYLSTIVDYLDGSVGYSEVIVFTGADRKCDSGGNRGGGIDITDPPNVLPPNPPNPPDHSDIDDSSDQEPESPEHSGGDESNSPKPDPTPAPTPEQPTKPDITPQPTPEPPDQSDTTPPSTIEPPDQSDTTPPSTIEPPDQSDTTPPSTIESPDQSDTIAPPTIKPPDRSDTTSAQEEPEKPEVALMPKPAIPLVEEIPAIGQTAPPAKVRPDLQASPQIISETEGEASNATLEDTEDGIPKTVDPVSPNAAGETPIAETMPPQSDGAGNKPLAKAVPLIIGGTVTIAVIGAAGVYHNERLRKRLWDALKKRIPTKK